MTIFAIRDEFHIGAYLFCIPEQDVFYIEIPSDITPAQLPLLLSYYPENHLYTVDSDWSRRWVEQRVVPPYRQNIGQMLRDNNLDRYTLYAFLTIPSGRCPQDDYYLEESSLEALPPEIQERLQHRVSSVSALASREILVRFLDGTETKFCADNWFEKQKNRAFPVFYRDLNKLQQVRPMPEGFGVYWDEQNHIHYDVLYDGLQG